MSDVKGPWADDEGDVGGIHNTETGEMILDHSVGLSPEQRRLIAAAPALRDALKELVDNHSPRDLCPDGAECPCQCPGCDGAAWYDKAMALLAMADGEVIP